MGEPIIDPEFGLSIDPCEHPSASGIDQTTGPGKVWRCDGCGWLHRMVPGAGGTSRMVAADPRLFDVEGVYLSNRALGRFADEVLADLDDDVVLVRATPTMRTVSSTLSFRGASGTADQRAAFDAMLRALSATRALYENLMAARRVLHEMRECAVIAHAAALQGGYLTEDAGDVERVRQALGTVLR